MFSLLVVLTVIGAAPGGTHSELSTSASVPANRTVSVHGVSLHYLDWGGTGEALVLLPAACETAHIYGDIAPAFTDRFRVLGPTTRGCGQSGRAPAYDLDTQLRELEGFLDAPQIKRATLAGFSASGGKTIRFARLYQSRVAKLVIFDSVYSYIAPGLEERVGAAIPMIQPICTGAITKLGSWARGLRPWTVIFAKPMRRLVQKERFGRLARRSGGPHFAPT